MLGHLSGSVGWVALGFPSGCVGSWDGDPLQVLDLLGSQFEMISSSPFAPPNSLK